MKGKKILIISSELWGDIFVSKHHYAQILSTSNEVYYLNPVSISWIPSNLFGPKINVVKDDSLNVIFYSNWLPVLDKLPLSFQQANFKRIARDICAEVNIESFDIVWSFDFKRFYDLKCWPSSYHFFHAVELVDHPFFIKDAPFRHEPLKTADFVVSIAKKITKEILPFNKKVLQLNHGFRSDHQPKLKKVEFPGSNSIKACFIGNFQISFDFEALRQSAEINQTVDFIMVGPSASSNLGSLQPDVIANIEQLNNLKNIHFVGAIPAEDIPSYLKQADILLILYKDEYSDGHCNPHKLMSYFHSGKVIVSSFIEEYAERPDLVNMATTNTDLPNLISKAVINLNKNNDLQEAETRIEFAQSNDYGRHIEKIEKFIEQNPSTNTYSKNG